MSGATDIVIIGAGPYGLSLATYLHEADADYRIIGDPMASWRREMPEGMLLKSEGFASNLYDPAGRYSLQAFCTERCIDYADVGVPVRLEVFSEYGLSFQKRLVPEVEQKRLVALDRASQGFTLTLDDGECFRARRVILAVGVAAFRYVPPALADLPPALLSHSADYGGLTHFRGREVAVIGGGSSAIDLAALLAESGAAVTLVSRRPGLEFHEKGEWPRPLSQRLRRPMTGIGPSWRSLFFTAAPAGFRRLPATARLRIVQRFLGPAGGWFMKDRVVGRVPLRLGCSVQQAVAAQDRAQLTLAGRDGASETLSTQHVIAATGYQVDLGRLDFLSATLRTRLRSLAATPVLSRDFQSSVPGLYFVGPAAASSFGPLMRFACGAKFVAPRLARHLLKRRRATPAAEDRRAILARTAPSS